MKKEILGAVLMVAAGAAMAQATVTAVSVISSQLCSGGNAAISASFGTAASGFVVTEFNTRCSANVILQGDDRGGFFLVAAASARGKNTFNGSSQGGAITSSASCASTAACTSTEVSTALGAATSL